MDGSMELYGDLFAPNLTGCNRAEQERIAHGSGETMRKPGEEVAPTAGAFKQVERSGKPTLPKNPSASPGRPDKRQFIADIEGSPPGSFVIDAGEP